MARGSASQFMLRLRSVLSSLKMTLKELSLAAREHDLVRLSALLREGSPLEGAIRGVLHLVFMVLLVAPILLTPAYYLLLTLA